MRQAVGRPFWAPWDRGWRGLLQTYMHCCYVLPFKPLWPPVGCGKHLADGPLTVKRRAPSILFTYPTLLFPHPAGSWASRSRWAACCSAPPFLSTLRSGWTFHAPCLTRTVSPRHLGACGRCHAANRARRAHRPLPTLCSHVCQRLGYTQPISRRSASQAAGGPIANGPLAAHPSIAGNLVSNAPHLPVHLGAMSEAVKFQIRHYAAGGDGAAEGLQVRWGCRRAWSVEHGRASMCLGQAVRMSAVLRGMSAVLRGKL